MRIRTEYFLLALFWAASRLSAFMDIEVGNGILIETTGGVVIQIDGNLAETGTGYINGIMKSTI
jgi:hypothetical protein